VDRKGGGKPPPKESGSFDLSKMSKAEIAAEIAARMARWRQAHQRPAVPARAPPAIGPAAPSPATPSDTPAAVQPVLAPEPDMVMVTRIDRALRIAAQARALQAERTKVRLGQEPSYYGAAFRTLLQEGPNQNAIGMRRERSVDRPLAPARMAAFRARELGAAPWRPLALAAPAGITRWRALRPALAHGIDVAQRCVRATGLATLGLGMAAWQELRPTLKRRIGEALRRAHALGAAARGLGSAAWRSLATVLERRIDQARRRIHATGVTARALAIAAWHGLMLTLAPRIDQAKQHIHAIGVTARALAITAWQGLTLTVAPRVDQAKQRIHAFGVTARARATAAWQAPASRFGMAGVTVIAAAIAAWCLMQPHGMVPPEIAGTSVVPIPREIAGAPAIDTPAIDAPVAPPPSAPAPAQPPSAQPSPAPAPIAEAPPAPEPAKPEEAVGVLAPVLKPPLPLPTLMAYLKPAQKTAAPARQQKPEPKLQEGGPLPPLPGATPSPATPDELRRRKDPRDFDIMLDQMFGDGAGRNAQAGALGRTVSSWLRLWPIWNDRIARPDDPGDPIHPARDVGEPR
jgi:hypothetical protein